MKQLNMFELLSKVYKICKPIRLIELFAGIGSQAMALRDLKTNYESWCVVEFDKYAILSYNSIHGTNYITSDIREIHAKDLHINETDKYEYILTYSFPCQDLSKAGKKTVWQRAVVHVVDYCGKLKGYWMNVENCLRYC